MTILLWNTKITIKYILKSKNNKTLDSQNLFYEVLEDSFISYAWFPENLNVIKGKFW
jgi:hypothetical protein